MSGTRQGAGGVSASLNPVLTLPGGESMTRDQIMQKLQLELKLPTSFGLDERWLHLCACEGNVPKCPPKDERSQLTADSLKLDRAKLSDTAMLGKITVGEAAMLLKAGIISERDLAAVELQAIRAVG